MTASPVYLHEFAKPGWSGTEPGLPQVKAEFHITDADLEGVTIILASYECEAYEGSAFVLFERDGKFWEVYGGHCSCYGLEGQWTPREVTTAELRTNLARNEYQYRECRAELEAALTALEAR